jgi:uncharacterized protein YjbI with pentapeptide repeats
MSINSIPQIPSETGSSSNNHSSLFEKLRTGQLIRDVTISARDIIRLIKEPHRIIRTPIRIEHSTIQGDLDLQYTTFKYGLFITDSVFEGTVNLSFSTFERSVDFSGSCFKERADFRAAHARYDFEIDLTTFLEDASFEDLHVDEIFRAQGAKFSSANFERIQVVKSVLFCPSHRNKLKRTHFCGEVNFSDAHIQGPAHFEGADFKKKAIFDRICFESVAVFKGYQHNDHVHRTMSETDHAVCHKYNHHKLDFLPTLFGGEASFAGAKINGDTSFSGVRFKDKLNFEHAKIDGDLDFQELKIRDTPCTVCVSFGGEALFRGAHVKGNASFDGAHFMKEANFAQFSAGGSTLFRPAKNQNKLIPVRFDDKAVFQNAHIQEMAIFSGAQFKKRAVFNRLQVGGGIYFDTCRLEPGWKEKAICIKLNDASDRAKRKAVEISFIRMCRIRRGLKYDSHEHEKSLGKVQSGAGGATEAFSGVKKLEMIDPWLSPKIKEIFIPATFHQETSFLDARIGSTADFDGAQFRGKASFERMHVGGGIFFRAVEYALRSYNYHTLICPVNFYGPVSFIGTHIRGVAEFDGVQFTDEKAEAVFERIEVYGNTYFRPFRANTSPAIFQGKVNFTGAYIKGDLEFSGAQFKKNADFKGMQIDGNAYFDARHHLDDLPINYNGMNRVSFSSLADFSCIHFKNEAYFDNTSFKKKANFDSAEINGIASFDKATFSAEATFNEARFSLLSFRIFEDQERDKKPRRPFWRLSQDGDKAEEKESQFEGSVDMRGTRYELIKANLTQLTEGFRKASQYDIQPYTQLEKVLRAIGNDHEADYVYLQRRHREREKFRRHFNKSPSYLLRFLFDWGYWKIGNYGIHPIKLFYYSVLIISLGAVIFTLPGAVEPKEEELVRIQKQIKAFEQRQAAIAPDLHQVVSAREDFINPVYDQESLGLTQAIGVSFSQFIPIVETPSGHRWKPSEKPIFCLGDYCISYAFYGSLHRMLGAIFVPLGVAALAVTLYRRAKLLHESAG